MTESRDRSALQVSDFDFDLPAELIAQQPPAERGTSRMLILDRVTGNLEDRHFTDLPSLLNPGDLLILNDSRVLPARLYARRTTTRGKQESTGQIEVFLTQPEAAENPSSQQWKALVKPGRKIQVGDQLEFLSEGSGSIQPSNKLEFPSERSGSTHPLNKLESLSEKSGSFQPMNQPELHAEGAGAFQPLDDLDFRTEGAGAFRPLNLPPTREGFSPGKPILRAEVIARGEFGERTLRFDPVANFYEALDQIGHMPLPPYIKRDDATADQARYQTVFADQRGSVAAPTAGLHFTPEIMKAIEARGVEIQKITLHVGLGTFAPLRVETVADIHLHSERYTLPAITAQALNKAKSEGRRIVAVGTTAVRTLEHVTRQSQGLPLQPHSGETSIFISPGHSFQLVNAMLTNFHLPKSSLLMLVSAFAGRENGRAQVLNAYRHAVQERYRFFSYGDCMFLS